MKWDKDQQIAILENPVSDLTLEALRKSLINNAGDNSIESAERLIDIMQDSELVGMISSDREDVDYAATSFVPMSVLYPKVKMSTPPVSLLKSKLISHKVPNIVADKVVKYVDFLNFKHHVAALVLVFFLIEKFRNA